MYKTILISIFLFCFNSKGLCLNYAPAKDVKSGKWGYVDENGKERTKFKYDLAFNFSYGKALALCKGVWYFIDKQKFKEEIADTFLQSYFNRIIFQKYNYNETGFECIINSQNNFLFLNPEPLLWLWYISDYSHFHLIGENKIFIYTDSYNSLYNIETHEMLLDKQDNIITFNTKNGFIVSKRDTSEMRDMPFYLWSYFFYDFKNNSLTKIDLKDFYIKPGYSIVNLEFFKELSPSSFYIEFRIEHYEFEHDIGNTDMAEFKWIKVFVTITDSFDVQMNIVPKDFTNSEFEALSQITSNWECHHDSSYMSELKKLNGDYHVKHSFQNGYTQLEFPSYYLCKKYTSPEEWVKMTLTQFKVIDGKLRYGAIRDDKWVVEPKYAYMGVFN